MFNLAVMYANGEGVGIDESMAAEWFHTAAANGHPRAEANAVVLERKSTRWMIVVGVTTISGGILLSWALSGLSVLAYDAAVDFIWPAEQLPTTEVAAGSFLSSGDDDISMTSHRG